MNTVTNIIKLRLEDLHPRTLERIKQGLTFKNPNYEEVLRRLRRLGRKPRIPEYITGYRIAGNQLIVPRGCAADLIRLGIKLTDRTLALPPTDFKFKGELKLFQETAVNAILGRKFSALCAPTGSGKTVMALYVIAQRKQPTLVIVHTAALLEQWVERARQFLALEEDDIGIIGQGRFTIGRKLTIALVQTLRRRYPEVVWKFGHIVCDECHRVPAKTFWQTVRPFPSRFSLGLSATHERRDGLTPLIYWYVGPLVHRIEQTDLIADGEILGVTAVIKETNFELKSGVDPVWNRAGLINELTKDVARNKMIINDVKEEIERGEICMVLTDRVSHAQKLTLMLKSEGVKCEACHGSQPRDERNRILEELENGKLNCIVATSSLLGEGFDCRRLSVLFLTTPPRFRGRLIQYLGRVTRTAAGKTIAKVYDYHDKNIDVLMRAARERLKFYQQLRPKG